MRKSEETEEVSSSITKRLSSMNKHYIRDEEQRPDITPESELDQPEMWGEKAAWYVIYTVVILTFAFYMVTGGVL